MACCENRMMPYKMHHAQDGKTEIMETKKHRGIAYHHIAEILSNYSHANFVSIEIGCGGKPYEPYLKGTYYGIDIRNDVYEGEDPDILCSGDALPFRDSSVDLIFTVHTLYQIPNCQEVFKEAYRVLKPRGKFLVFDYNWHVTRRLEKAAPGVKHKFTPLCLWYFYIRNGFKPKWIFHLPESSNWVVKLLNKFKAGNLIRHLLATSLIFSGEKKSG